MLDVFLKKNVLLFVLLLTSSFELSLSLGVAFGLAFELWLSIDQFLNLDLCCFEFSFVGSHHFSINLLNEAVEDAETFFTIPPYSPQKLDEGAAVSAGAADDQ